MYSPIPLLSGPQSAEYRPLLTWLLGTGVIFLLLFVAWNEGSLAELYAQDRSRLSWAISVLFAALFLHSVMQAVRLSYLSNHSLAISALLNEYPHAEITLEGERIRLENGLALPPGPLSHYIRSLLQAVRRSGVQRDTSTAELLEAMDTELKGRLELGWFVADLMIKLGLLGTIVGFILMLASVSDISNFDADTMRDVLQHMSTGMGTALYTTLAGLSCSLMLSVQYHMLERYTDEVVDYTRSLAELRLRPALGQSPVEAPDKQQ